MGKIRLLATTAIVAASATVAAQAAKADTLVITNSAAFGNGPISTVDITTGTFVNSFIPDQAAIDSNNGRAVEVLGNFVYYTELTGGFGASTGIFVAPFNNGAGGTDIKSFANPVPGTGIVDLAAAGGELFAMTGYPSGPEVVQATDGNGNNIGGPITLTTLSGGNLSDSDGFTVLPNGNWLINDGDAVNSYNQYDPTTGAEIAGTNIIAPAPGGGACGGATGVDNDGANLFFDCNFSTIVETDMAGNFITSVSNGSSTVSGEDISLIQASPITPPTVPEPSTWAMMLIGFIGLGYVGYRSSNQRRATLVAG